jgi:hypothetical protein
LAASARSAQCIDTKVRRGAIQPSTDVAIDLQSGLTVQTPKSIACHFFGTREIAEQAHQYGNDSGIVLKKNRPEFRFVPMLR